VQALVVPTSALNRYRLRPWESTRIFPRLVLARLTVADAPVVVFGGVAVVALPPPPQAATDSTASG
jgi:hypothetical protein